MSSSDPRTPAPAPWALDELALDEVFAPLYEPHGRPAGTSGTQPHGTQPPGAPAPAADPAAAAHEAAVEARVAERIASARPAIERDAYARGHADGLHAGAEQAREPVGRVVQALVEATTAIRDHEQRWLANVEENLAALAVTIARHLIQRELTTDPSVVTDLVARALRQFPLEKQLTVRLHPDDHAIVQEAHAAGALAAADALDVHWLADAHIVRGGCLVEGRERVLDGRMDTALERAYRALGQVQA